MRLTLIRHAEAGDDAPRDESRALTIRGRKEARRVGRALGRRGVSFSLIVSSPLFRALQTAEIVAAAVDFRGRVLSSDLILPEADPKPVIAYLQSLEGERSVALVAHEPILSRVAARLIQEPSYPPLRKAEALRIRIPERSGGGPVLAGVLRWRVDPASGRRERL